MRGVALATAIGVAGCQTTSSFERSVGVQPVAADDACGAASTALRQSQGFFERSIVQGAAIGAIGGAILGGFIGGNAKSAVGGALLGGLAGAGSGYLVAREREAKSRAELANTVYGDVRQESAEVVQALAKFSSVRQCRLNQANFIKSAVAGGRMDRQAGTRALALERQRYNDDIAVVRAISGRIDERHKDLLGATEALSQNDAQASQLLTQAKSAESSAWSNPDTFASASSSGQKQLRATTGVNVRAQPAASSRRVGGLSSGELAYQVEPSSNGWTKIRLGNGAVGYVASEYLTDRGTGSASSKPSSTSSSAAPALASLTRSIPSAASTEAKTVGALFEGREKRIELERLKRQAEREEVTVFSLDG